jgi:predicted nucleic acid-binding protein
MNGNNAILDSNILIYASKGLINLKNILSSYTRVYISAITYMEVMGYKFISDEEKMLTERLVNSFEVIHTTNYIIGRVIEFKRKSKIKLPDAIILATCGQLKASLITNNEVDFRNLDDSIKIIIPTELKKV